MIIKLKHCLATLLLLFIISNLLFIMINKDNNNQDQRIAQVVVNNTDYYDVNTIVNKFINSTDKKEIINMLNKKYVIENKINEKNLYKYRKNLSHPPYGFLVKKMYYIDISKNLTNYYVYGQLSLGNMDNNDKGDDYYIMISIDNENKTFAITLDDGALFKEVTK